jgi:hypothetical protein
VPLIAVTVLGTAAVASAGGRPLDATMTGVEEVPPGDPDGSGSASFTFNPGFGEVCFELVVEDIQPATAAHIHVGDAGVAGPIVIPLAAPTEGSAGGCVADVDRGLIVDILHRPWAYYVNAEFPAGAVRGQLSK